MNLTKKPRVSSLQHRRIRIQDISIAYLVKPASRSSNLKPPMVFLHGFPFNKNMWTDQLMALPADQMGIAVDIRGHGNSTIGQGFFNIPLFVQDLIHFLDSLAIDKVILCGVSMGGYIALQMMETAPERIAGLILSNTNCFADDNEAKMKRFQTIQSILKHGNRTFAISFSQKLFTKASQDNHIPAIEKIMRSIRRNNIRSICSTLLALGSRLDTSHILESISVPTYIIYGEKDLITPKEQSVYMHQRIKNSEIFEIEASGHLPNIENAAAFNSVLLEYLSKFEQ